jgi:hypothetical protein
MEKLRKPIQAGTNKQAIEGFYWKVANNIQKLKFM